MSRTDLVGDAFTVIRNGVKVKKESVLIPYSKLLLNICELLKKEGYIENFKEVEVGTYKQIKVYLKYEEKKSALNQIKRVSKPGRRIYLKRKEIKPVLSGYGLAIVSTSLGVLTGKEAREKGVGGEIIGVVW
ncbi:MAG TPA: 30S ribosomal protein S8 [Candidatus Omnitrophica bacterium]|nr:30S ribosomal protein S8 [Candidatus Omnitrophota bacterium]